MCGIAGLLDRQAATPADRLGAEAEAMAATLAHRGPDDDGVWVDAESGIAFGHRRLAIIDRSDAGRQPMASPDGRYVITFNGEIYNFGELREELVAQGMAFRGHCDTEVLLGAITAWGLSRALDRSDGMFAFALWDRQDRTLHLVRDRLGEKPLYYGLAGGKLLFASELKAIRAHPAFTPTVDRKALGEFMRYRYVPTPMSIYEGVWKLAPGSLLSIGPEHGDSLPEPRRWWVIPATGVPTSNVPRGSIVDELENRLLRSIRRRVVADVPVGAFLSGGVDSSTVVALMQTVAAGPVRTFTIGFREAAFDEADDADRVAQHLGTDHTRIDLTPDEARSVIPDLAQIYDEPFADSSQIPTALVSAVARQHVTVALSGDGGDELFGGYNRHRWIPAMHRRLSRIPAGGRAAVARALQPVRPAVWDRLAGPIPTAVRPRLPADKLEKIARILPLESPDQMYAALVSHWETPTDVVIGADESPPALPSLADSDLAAAVMLADAKSYLPDDILSKVDRASMRVSLEARLPMLAPDLVEWAMTLPSSVKLAGRTQKWPLRKLLARYVPAALTERPKMGFGVPIGDWLRGPLRPWAEDLMARDRLCREGFLHPGPIRARWDEHLSGRSDWSYHLWDVLVFQSWLERWGA